MTLLKLSRVDDSLRITNMVGKELAYVDRWDIKFFNSVTAEELKRINAIAQDFEFHLLNIEEHDRSPRPR